MTHATSVDDTAALLPAADQTRGSGKATACCGHHRDRCLFGGAHCWAVWYEDGRLVRTRDTFRCDRCGGVCTADEDAPQGRP